MELEKDKWDAVRQAIELWEADNKISPDQAAELRKTIRLKQKNDRQQIAQYFFLVSISCIILAFGAIFIDEKLLEKLKTYFALGNITIAFISVIVASLWFWYIYKHKRSYSRPAFEMYTVLGGLVSLTALVYICKDIGFGPSRSGFLLTAFFLLLVLSILFRSVALWIGALFAVTGWYWAFSTWASHQNLFLGMNYPVRFTLFGVGVIGLSLGQLKIDRLYFAQRITYVAGLVIFFAGMWGASIFGNFGYLEDWAKVRQASVIGYSLVFGFSAIMTFYFGIRYKDDTTRDMGVLFLLLNLYSRYFEFFWNAMNKGLFFLILAVSFWFIGRRIEKRRAYRKNDEPTI